MNQLGSLVLGLQHIGIPTQRFAETIAFYKSLGFTIIREYDGVAFLSLAGLSLEVYEIENPALSPGAIDHIALNVSDIQATYTAVRSLGYRELESGIQTLPFFTKGVSYFTIIGPNAENIEFAQYL